MSVSSYLRSLAAKFLRPAEMTAEMEEELRTHLSLRADDLQRTGLTREQAERRARIEYGSQEKFKEQCHQAMGANFLDILVLDFRFAIRTLRKSPGFAAIAVLTLALAIGANAVVFGVLDALVLRPLNVPQGEDLWGTKYGIDTGFQSYPNYVDLRDRNRSFEDLAAFNFAFVGIDTGKDASQASGYATTGNYFDVLRVQPHLGRFFHSSDEHGANSAPHLVLSYAYWHSRFQDDRSVLGRTVQINKHPFTIIGVAPPGFRGTLLFVSPDFFMPIVNQEQVNGQKFLDDRGNSHSIFETIGHLKPGVTPAQALADVKAVGTYLEKTYPKEFSQKTTVLGHPGLSSFDTAVRQFMTGLMLLAALILLAACANLGALFAARAADRSREVALRLALGSSRNRILRQLLTEAILISVVGGGIGLLGSIALLHQMSMWQPFSGTPIRVPISPDARIYVVALVLALLSGFLFGIVPVRQVFRTNPYEIVKAGPSGRIGRRFTVRDALLVVQIALCAVLVTSSVVALRGLGRSLHADLGFEPNTMLVGTNLMMAGYSTDSFAVMQKRMINILESTPGVEQVGLVNNQPPLVYAAASRVNIFKEDTSDLRPSNVAGSPYKYDVSPQYFSAAGTALLAGREFTWHDDKDAPPVSVVNREFAIRSFGSVANAVGRYYKLQDGTRVQVAGVVADGKYLSLTEAPEPTIFLPSLRSPASVTYMVVRSRRNPQELASALRIRLRELDSALPVDTATWSTMLEVALFPARVATVALGVLGLMGAVLSVSGIFGMAAYSVSKRLRELGVRVALGAQRKQVLQAALGRAFKLLVIGSAAGLLLGMLASKILAFIVYQASPRDPAVLAGVVVTMALLGLISTWIPARRALSVEPSILLREE